MARKRRMSEIDEIEANKSDSNDGDYDEKEARASTRKKERSHKPASRHRKRPRRSGSDVLSSDDDELLDDSFSERSIEEPVLDPVTGRPKRNKPKQVDYNVDKSTDEDEFAEPEDEDEEETGMQDEIEASEDEHLSKTTVKAAKNPKKTSKLITLKISPQKQLPRTTRTRSRQTSAEPLSAGTRRSSRHKDNPEATLALTPSGKHTAVISRSRTGTPDATSRPTTSGKGMKRPVAATIEETIEESPASLAAAAAENESENLHESEVDEGQEDNNEHGKSNVASGQGDNEPANNDDADEPAPADVEEEDEEDEQPLKGRKRISKTVDRDSQKSSKKNKNDEDSDFEAADDDDGDDMSSSEASEAPGPKDDENEDDESGSNRRSRRTRNGANRSRSNRSTPAQAEELAEEVEELTRGNRRARRAAALVAHEPILRDRRGKQVDYRVFRTETLAVQEDEVLAAPSPSRRPRGAAASGWQRTLFPTSGPFGGAGGLPSVFGGPGAIGAAGGVDSDSSDDERMQRPSNFNAGMTPTSAFPPGLLPSAQTHSADPLQNVGASGTPANLGKIKDRQALADADPLGVDPNVSFDNVGGLDGHINQLQEMVALPLLYPEIFSRFHVTPPRGVLFHGPPGTGKTLLARALANSVSSHGRKVTFYMRKGADALSKWVGEAERQLRLLFDEARKTQPSIIFFDEIDGLAPVRSSKQEQIHASIVSTLLALMDGMDGRGQVIVIGATNRPDSVDPALRRPGRFDREFYFPLPSTEARRAILDIHTKGWQPGLSNNFKDELAEVTKGYGGADLRALCTEAALNAVQRRYPQIYKSKEKLVIDPSSINVSAKDFMISVKKLVPSSERSASSGSAPLPKIIEPLLRATLAKLKTALGEIMPQNKARTALEEAEFEDNDDSTLGFVRERIQQDFESSRLFRPRLLIHGKEGMGQQYLAAAILNHFEGLHVQSFDLPTLLNDSTRSSEAAIVQLFTEVKRHKPAVIFLPNVDVWWDTIGDTALSTFLGLLRSIPPTDPILVLGVMEGEIRDHYLEMAQKIFGFQRQSRIELSRPAESNRREYFEPLVNHVKRSPDDFPDPTSRKKRKLEVLKVAPAPPPKLPSKQEIAALKKKDRQTLNLLKIRIQPIMDQIKLKYRIFRNPPIDITHHPYLYEEDDPDFVVSDIIERSNRQYEKSQDKDDNPGLREPGTNKFFYNMDITSIEERLSNGYYCRPRDFFRDINFLAKDARALEDRNKMIKANELVANVDVDIAMFESDPIFMDCENIHRREIQRRLELDRKAQRKNAENLETQQSVEQTQVQQPLSAGEQGEDSSRNHSGAVSLGMPAPSTPRRSQQSLLSNGVGTGVSNVADGGNFSQLSSNGISENPHDADKMVIDTETPYSDNQDKGAGSAESQQHIWGLPPNLQRNQTGSTGYAITSGTDTQPSQRGIITSMRPDSQIDDYVNDASTTTSEKKTSESHRSSGPQWATQGSNGILGKDTPSNESGLPDTQEGPPSSQDGSAPRNKPHPSSITSLLNDSSPVNAKLIQVNQSALDTFRYELVSRSSGCSIEQLQLVNSRLMDLIWKTRGDWNRSGVLLECADVLEMTMEELATEVGESSSSRTRRAVEAAMQGQAPSGIGFL